MWSGPAISSLSMPAPLYVEASSLLDRRLTGIGRFVARLLEALVRLRPIRLVTTVQAEMARNLQLSTAFLCGQEFPRDGQLWQNLRRAIELRDRCVHPKPPFPYGDDLTAADAEFREGVGEVILDGFRAQV